MKKPRAAVTDVNGEKVAFHGGLTTTHVPLTNVADANSMGDALVDSGGNYPRGMEPCFVAGLNGDQTIEDHCIFDEDPDCRCQELLGFTPRDECTAHSEAEHYPTSM